MRVSFKGGGRNLLEATRLDVDLRQAAVLEQDCAEEYQKNAGTSKMERSNQVEFEDQAAISAYPVRRFEIDPFKRRGKRSHGGVKPLSIRWAPKKTRRLAIGFPCVRRGSIFVPQQLIEEQTSRHV